MEMTIISEYKTGAIQLRNKQLRKSTDILIKNMRSTKDAFCRAALELKKIRDQKLYKDDFTDADGKPSFVRYCEDMLGISKSQASRIIQTGTRLLAPELIAQDDERKPEYFANFGDTNLSIIATVSENYEECQQFCVDYNIDETTAQKDVRAAVKEYKASKRGEVDAEGETTDDAPTKKTQREMKEEIAEFLRSDLNALVKKYPNFAGIITCVAKEW